MAHFARLDENNSVTEVIVVSNDVLENKPFPESEPIGILFCKNLYGKSTNWVQTSYNSTFRKNFAGHGFLYDNALDAFIAPKPGQYWELNTDTCQWQNLVVKNLFIEADKILPKTTNTNIPSGITTNEYFILFERTKENNLFVHNEIVVPWTNEVKQNLMEDSQNLFKQQQDNIYAVNLNEDATWISFVEMFGFKRIYDIMCVDGIIRGIFQWVDFTTVPYPNDGKFYYWDKTTLSWILIQN